MGFGANGGFDFTKEKLRKKIGLGANGDLKKKKKLSHT